MASSSQSTSSRALLYFSERVEDATEAVKGLLGAAAGTGVGGQKYVDTSDDHVRDQLESDRDEVRIDGLKTVITLISKGREASAYFPSVVKLSSNGNLEIRKLVYIIVRRYAQRQPDIALLGINSFQRDLQDRNEVVRAMALRVLTGLRLKMAASVVELAIAKCVRDSHFYVRRAAALAIRKSLDISPHIRETFVGHIKALLQDRNPFVLGATLTAWSVVCPSALDLLHPHYRKLCYALGDMDEWTQCESLAILGHYAKRCLPQPSLDGPVDRDLELLLTKANDLLSSSNTAVTSAACRLVYALGPSTRRNVIARPLVRLVKKRDNGITYFALLNCLFVAQTAPEVLVPHLYDFLPRSSLHESGHCTRIKMQIMVRLVSKGTAELVLQELMEQAQSHPNKLVAATAIDQIGHWATRCDDDKQRRLCVRQLFQLLKEKRTKDLVVARILNVIRDVVERGDAATASSIVVRLAPLLFAPSSTSAKDGKKKAKTGSTRFGLQSSSARATIYWLLGQYCRLTAKTQKGQEPPKEQAIAEVICLDVLRKAALNFVKENTDAKLQIVTLSTKLVSYLPTVEGVASNRLEALTLLHAYILELARYDAHFDVRDRARFCKALTDRFEVGVEKLETEAKDEDSDDHQDEKLGGVVLRREQVLHILFEQKGSSRVQKGSKVGNNEETWNTLEAALGRRLSSQIRTRLPDYFDESWTDPSQLPPSSVREASSASQETSAKPTGGDESKGEAGASKAVSYDDDEAYKVQKVLGSVASDLDASHAGASSTIAAPFQQAAGAKIKYKNLDDFLDAEEAVEEQEITEEESSEEEYDSDSEDGQLYEDEDDVVEDDDEGEEESDDDEADEAQSDSETDSSASHDAKPKPSPSVLPLPAEENAWA